MLKMPRCTKRIRLVVTTTPLAGRTSRRPSRLLAATAMTTSSWMRRRRIFLAMVAAGRECCRCWAIDSSLRDCTRDARLCASRCARRSMTLSATHGLAPVCVALRRGFGGPSRSPQRARAGGPKEQATHFEGRPAEGPRGEGPPGEGPGPGEGLRAMVHPPRREATEAPKWVDPLRSGVLTPTDRNHA